MFSDIFEPLFLFLQKLEKPFGRTLLFCHCQVISSETGCLRNRTRILVTHGVGFLDKVDRIFVMKDGAIVEVGSHGELMAKKGAFSEFLTTYQSERQKKYGEDKEVAQERKKTVSMSSGKGIPMQRQLPSDSRLPTGTSPRSWAHFQPSVCDDEEDDLSVDTAAIRGCGQDEVSDRSDSDTQPLVQGNAQLVEEEMAKVGRVQWSVYLKYIENIGAVVALVCLLMYMAGQGLQIGANAWLSVWADANHKTNGSSTIEKVRKRRLDR